MTPNEIRNMRFGTKMGGYRVEEVNEFLTQVAASMQQLQDEKTELAQKLAVLAEKLEEYREDEESLRAALIGAQKLGDSVVRDAKEKAERMLEEAAAKADELVADARTDLDRESFALTRMQAQVADFKARVLELYRAQVEMIEASPDQFDIPQDVSEILERSSARQQYHPPVYAPPEEYGQPQYETPGAEYAADDEEYAQTEFEGEAGYLPQELELEPADSIGEGAIAFQTLAAEPPVARRADKVDNFVLSYDELDDLPQEPTGAEPAQPQRLRRQSYGDLRFGEEYNLTRND